MTIAGAAVGVSAQCTRGHSLEFGPFIHLFRKKTMKSDEAGFWTCLSVLRGTLRSVGWILFLQIVHLEPRAVEGVSNRIQRCVFTYAHLLRPT